MAVERLGKVCFDTCDQSDPMWKITDCYLVCYINTLVSMRAPHDAALGCRTFEAHASGCVRSRSQSFIPNCSVAIGWTGCVCWFGLERCADRRPGLQHHQDAPGCYRRAVDQRLHVR
jgi:hypothetical protein